MKARFTYLFLLILTQVINAQPFNIAWQKCLGGSANEKKPVIIARTDQSYTVGFSTFSNNGDITGNHGDYDWAVYKYDKDQVNVINKLLGGTKIEDFNNISENADKTYLAIGSTTSNDGNVSGLKGGVDAWVAKLVANTAGIQWRKCVGGTGDDEGAVAIEVDGGSYLLVGSTKSADGDFTSNAGGKDIFLIKTDLNGIFAWAKTYGGSLDDKAVAAVALSDGYVIASESISSNGPATNSNHGGKDILLMKVDLTGTLVWAKFLGGSGDDTPSHLLVTSDGNILLTGTTASNNGDVSGNHGLNDIWLVKLTNGGSIIWSKCIGGTADDSGSMTNEYATPNKYYVIGTTASNNGNITGAKGGKDIYVAKINTSGAFEESKNFGGTSDDIGTSIDITYDKALLLAGETSSTNGDVSGNHGGGDIWIAKVAGPTATFEPVNDFNLTVAPNPAKQNLTVTLPSNIDATEIYITTITGITKKIVSNLSGINNNSIDLSDLSSGHYFITVKAKQGISRQMIEVVK